MYKRIGLAIISICVIAVIAVLTALYVSNTTQFPFSFGLDLAGGTQVTYTADISNVPDAEIAGRMGSTATGD